MLPLSVFQPGLTAESTRRPNGMAQVVSCKNQNSSYRGRFFLKGKLNLVQVNGGGGGGGEFELSEFELPGFY